MGLLDPQLLSQMQQSPQWAQMAQRYGMRQPPTMASPLGQSTMANAGAMPAGIPQPGQWYGGSIMPQQMQPPQGSAMTDLSQQMGQYGMPQPGAGYMGNFAQPGMTSAMSSMMTPQQMMQRYAPQQAAAPQFADRMPGLAGLNFR